LATFEHVAGYILTAVGLIAMLISFTIQKGDFDPTAFGVAIAAIFLAIVGIAMILYQDPSKAVTSNSHPQLTSNIARVNSQ
jgi:hypothetical protein